MIRKGFWACAALVLAACGAASDGGGTEPVPARCGDGNVDAGEACDDGVGNSDASPGACRTDCTEASCGDGVVDGGEGCDDGNRLPDDGCSATCAVEARCGDGAVDPGEACDDGAANSDTTAGACRTDCSEPRCGDGVQDPGEGCDQGDANDDAAPDACRTSCLPADCGDGVIDGDETCDDGDDNSDTEAGACRTSCVPAQCGDGVVDPEEACDAGEENSDTEPDGCRTTCAAAGCGDGVIDTGEGCDDGNTEDGDGCSASCQDQAICGDGLREAPEACDDGGTVAGDGCGETCALEADVCGAVIVDLGADATFGSNGFTYDGDSANSGDEATASCTSGDGEEQVLALWVPQRARLTLTTDGGIGWDQDTLVSVRTDCADLATELACNEDTDVDGGIWTSTVVLDDVAAGTQLYVIVDSYGEGSWGFPYTLTGSMAWYVGEDEACDVEGITSVCEPELVCRSGTCVAAGCGDGIVSPAIGEDCDDGNIVSGDGCTAGCKGEGDTCAAAIVPTFDPVTQVATAQGLTTPLADDATPGCGDGLSSPDAFVRFTSTVTGFWDFQVSATWDVLLYARETCGDAMTEYHCANDMPAGGSERFRVWLDQGTVTTLVIEGAGGESGAFTLTGTPIPTIPEGGSCDPAEQANVCETLTYCNGDAVCVFPSCGNNVIEPGEQCDDGNHISGDGCSNRCAAE